MCRLPPSKSFSALFRLVSAFTIISPDWSAGCCSIQDQDAVSAKVKAQLSIPISSFYRIRRRFFFWGIFRRPAPAAGTVERSRVTPTALVTDTRQRAGAPRSWAARETRRAERGSLVRRGTPRAHTQSSQTQNSRDAEPRLHLTHQPSSLSSLS